MGIGMTPQKADVYYKIVNKLWKWDLLLLHVISRDLTQWDIKQSNFCKSSGVWALFPSLCLERGRDSCLSLAVSKMLPVISIDQHSVIPMFGLFQHFPDRALLIKPLHESFSKRATWGILCFIYSLVYWITHSICEISFFPSWKEVPLYFSWTLSETWCGGFLFEECQWSVWGRLYNTYET